MVDRPATDKLVENAYTGTVHQAYQFLQAVEVNRKQPLSDHCIGNHNRNISFSGIPFGITYLRKLNKETLFSFFFNISLPCQIYC